MSQDDIQIDVPLYSIPGSAEGQKEDDHNTKHHQKPREDEDEIKNHRKLAICSIICGCSCVGYQALEKSFQVDQEKSREQKLKYSKKAKKYSIISIVVLYGILILIPLLLVFISYLLTLKD